MSLARCYSQRSLRLTSSKAHADINASSYAALKELSFVTKLGYGASTESSSTTIQPIPSAVTSRQTVFAVLPR